jgi:hypothetical protein
MLSQLGKTIEKQSSFINEVKKECVNRGRDVSPRFAQT